MFVVASVYGLSFLAIEFSESDCYQIRKKDVVNGSVNSSLMLKFF